MSPHSAPPAANRLAVAALAALGLLLAPAAAFASTAANTTLSNTATVNFNDAAGVAQTPVTATATVTVTLVPSAATLSSPASVSIAQGTSAALTYTITGTANGPDTYNLASTASPTNVSSVTPTLPASVALGGTTLAADAKAGDTTIKVPFDGTVNGTVNGIAPGATIVIGGNAYTVAAGGVDESTGVSTNVVTITLTTAIAGPTVTAGNIVGERRTFQVTVPSGTVASGGTGSQSVSTTATASADPKPATTQATATVVTVNRPTLTVTKLVSTDGGTTFAATASATPGTKLTYKVVAKNTGATDASAVAFSDVLPKYLTYVAGSGRSATDSTLPYGSATNVLMDGAGGYTYTAGTSTISYAPPTPTSTVAAGASLVLYYQATIN